MNMVLKQKEPKLAQKALLFFVSLLLLFFLLCDPLWFNTLNFTTKEHEVYHKEHEGLLIQPRLLGIFHIDYYVLLFNQKIYFQLELVINGFITEIIKE